MWHRGADGGGSPVTTQCEKVVATNVTEGLKDLIGVLGHEHRIAAEVGGTSLWGCGPLWELSDSTWRGFRMAYPTSPAKKDSGCNSKSRGTPEPREWS